jgi:hypothetical protein
MLQLEGWNWMVTLNTDCFYIGDPRAPEVSSVSVYRKTRTGDTKATCLSI